MARRRWGKTPGMSSGRMWGWSRDRCPHRWPRGKRPDSLGDGDRTVRHDDFQTLSPYIVSPTVFGTVTPLVGAWESRDGAATQWLDRRS